MFMTNFYMFFKVSYIYILKGIIVIVYSLFCCRNFLSISIFYLLTAFNLGAKSNNTRNAWRELNTAVMRFNQNIVQEPEVINAYERGETMIGGITFTKEGIETQGTSQQKN